jgi:hypothetical protein
MRGSQQVREIAREEAAIAVAGFRPLNVSGSRLKLVA